MVGMSTARAGLIERQIAGGQQHDEAEQRDAGPVDGQSGHAAERHAEVDEHEDGDGEGGHGSPRESQEAME